MSPQNSFTYKLDPDQQAQLVSHLRGGNYKLTDVPHTVVSAQAEGCTVALYTSGKCLIQGKGAREWVTFILEPNILKEVRVGYEDILNPELIQPHMGIDESGKGDFFGPMIIAAAYVDEPIVEKLREMDVRDSKRITSDRKALDMARDIRELLGHRFAVVSIGPSSYNRLYAKMRNVNSMLAWGHARAIEDLLEKVPDCPRAISDQFGPKRQIEQALMKKGKDIRLEQRPKAESDPAVAAASVLARAGFVHALQQMGKKLEIEIPKGASDAVRARAEELVTQKGPKILLETAKCHFRTADRVLEATSFDRSALGPEGAAVSRAVRPSARRS